MCILCIELQKEYMTAPEIARAYNETVDQDDPHWIEVMRLIDQHSDLPEVSEALYSLRKERNASKD